MAKGDDVKLTRDTYIPIGVAATLFAFLLSSGIWFNNVVNQLETAIMLMNHEISDMNNKLDNSLEDRWTASDMENWAELLKAKNTTLDVPKPVPAWKRND